MRVEIDSDIPLTKNTRNATKILLSQGWEDSETPNIVSARETMMEAFRPISHEDNYSTENRFHPFLNHLDYIFGIKTELAQHAQSYRGMGTAHQFMFKNIMSALTLQGINDRDLARAVTAIKKIIELTPGFGVEPNEISCEVKGRTLTLSLGDKPSFQATGTEHRSIFQRIIHSRPSA